jgi:type I restriction enzyme S subunit
VPTFPLPNFYKVINDGNFKKLKQLILKAAFHNAFSDEPQKLMINSVIDIHNNRFRKLPLGWKWMKIRDLADSTHNYPVGDGDHGLIKPSDYTNSGIPYIRVKDIINDSLNLRNVEHISFETHNKSLKSELHPYDVLIAKTGATLGKCCIIPENVQIANTTSSVAKITLDPKKILVKYFYYYVLSSEFQNQIWSYSQKTAQPGFNNKDLKVFKVPVAPIKQQEMIVNKIEQMLDLYYSLEREYEKKEKLHKILVKNIFTNLQMGDFLVKNNFMLLIENEKDVDFIRKYIFEKAVLGRLVPQDPNDEPASEIVKRVKAEKDNLIKENKIKKEKSLSVITFEEIPFKIPKNWIWTRLGSLGVTQTGTTPSTNKPEYYGGDIPFIKPADISRNAINYNNESLSDKGLSHGRIVPKDSLMMVCIGGSTGKAYFNNRDCSCNQQINTLKGLSGITGKFLYYFTASSYFQDSVWSKSTGSATNIINKFKWTKILFPLPPINEQKRIVEKIDHLLNLCDKLEEKVKDKQKYSDSLINIVLKEAFTV